MMRGLSICATVLAVVLPLSSVCALVPAGISGAWYNPVQNGHGVSIEVLDEQRALAFWYVYDGDGQPLHLYIDGRIDGSHIRGTAYRGSGMRFGQFDPATLSVDIWGQVDIDIQSCSSLNLTYTSNGPAGAAYGDGAIAMTRLSELKGLACVPEPLPTGLYQGSFALADNSQIPILVGAVDEEGSLWAAPLNIRSPRFVGSTLEPPVLTGVSVANSDRMPILALGNTGLDDEGPFSLFPRLELAPLVDTFGNPQVHVSTPDSPWLRSISLSQTPQIEINYGRLFFTGELARPVPLQAFTALRYRFTALAQFVDDTYGLSFDESGQICLKRPITEPLGCEWLGQIQVRNATSAFFDFELHPGPLAYGMEGRTPLIGRGWVLQLADGTPTAVVMVGNDGRNGFGILATRDYTSAP
jgi:hypothetical protein